MRCARVDIDAFDELVWPAGYHHCPLLLLRVRAHSKNFVSFNSYQIMHLYVFVYSTGHLFIITQTSPTQTIPPRFRPITMRAYAKLKGDWWKRCCQTSLAYSLKQYKYSLNRFPLTEKLVWVCLFFADVMPNLVKHNDLVKHMKFKIKMVIYSSWSSFQANELAFVTFLNLLYKTAISTPFPMLIVNMSL